MLNIYLGLLITTLLVIIFCKKTDIMSYITIATTSLILIYSVLHIESFKVIEYITYNNGLFYIDSLSLIQLLIISSISFIAAIYSHKYIKRELLEEIINLNTVRLYYVLFNSFVVSMILVAISNNVIVIWIGLEATTLSTAFLIGFSRQKLSLEAAWKYIVICSIGIAIGLVGIVLLIYSMNSTSLDVMRWSFLVKNTDLINSNIAKFAFCFIFVGVGTKVGLVPMHTWLPDGHSESPSPISAMMSGVLLNLALYVIIRFYVIIKNVSNLGNIKYIFILFGILSLIVASLSIIKQKNYKRLLAFSSIENMGIITLGIGIGGDLALYGALLHSMIHAFGKTILFLISGNILNVYKSKRIEKVRNLIKIMPINSIILIIAILIITGIPPFASFISEYSILAGIINNGSYVLAVVFLLCLLVVFAGFINIFIKMIFGDSDKFDEKSSLDRENIAPLLIALVFVLIISFWSTDLNLLINKAVRIIN